MEYFITEYYTEFSSKDKWLGFPILQQNKLWTKEEIDLIGKNQASLCYAEWFGEFSRFLHTLNELYIKTQNPCVLAKLLEWIEVGEYYQQQVGPILIYIFIRLI